MLLARRREVQSTISFTANSAPDAARLTLQRGPVFGQQGKSRQAQRSDEHYIAEDGKSLGFLKRRNGADPLGHFVSAAIANPDLCFVRIPLQFKQRDAMTN